MTFAPWQRLPRPTRRVRCCVCYRRVRITDTWPVWDERVCRDCMSVDDRRIHRLEFGGPNVRPPGIEPAIRADEEDR